MNKEIRLVVSAGKEVDGDHADTASGAAHNQSVVKAVALIGCFVRNNDGLTLTELARSTGMNMSTAYRMLQTLTLTGVLRRNHGEERYFVGPLLLTLAGSTFSHSGYRTVQDILTGLAEETEESVSFGIRDTNCVAVLLTASSPQQLRFEHKTGDRLPIHCSSMGKALLAFDNSPLPETVASLGYLQRRTSKTIVHTESLIRELGEVRGRGYAICDEELFNGVKSVAVVCARDREPARAAIGVQGPAGRMTPERIERFVEAANGAASLISQLPILDRLPI